MSLEQLLDFSIVQERGEIVKRELSEFLAERSEYVQNSEPAILFSLGPSQMVYGPNCYLSYVFQYDEDVSGNRGNFVSSRQPMSPLGHNNFSLICQDLQIKNDQIELIDEKRIDKRVDVIADLCSRKYLKTHAQTAGFYDPNEILGTNVAEDLDDENFTSRFMQGRSTGLGTAPDPDLFDLDQSVTVPMHMISGLFSKEHLIPFSLMKGQTKIQMKLKPAALAGIWGGTGVTNYKVSNLKLHLDTYEISDALMAELMTARDSSGLEFSYNTWEHVQRPINTGGKHTVDLFRGVKRLSKVLGFITAQPNEESASGVSRDSLSRYVYTDAVNSWDVRIGSVKYPQNNDVTSMTQSYIYSISNWGLLDDCDMSPGVTLGEYQSDRHFMIVDVTRDPNIIPDNATGVETESSRRVSFELNLKPPKATIVDPTQDRRASGGYIVNMYVQYSRNIKILDNRIIIVN